MPFRILETGFVLHILQLQKAAFVLFEALFVPRRPNDVIPNQPSKTELEGLQQQQDYEIAMQQRQVKI